MLFLSQFALQPKKLLFTCLDCFQLSSLVNGGGKQLKAATSQQATHGVIALSKSLPFFHCATYVRTYICIQSSAHVHYCTMMLYIYIYIFLDRLIQRLNTARNCINLQSLLLCVSAGVDSPDYSLFPDREYQLQWMRAYLEESTVLRGIDPSLVSEEDVESLYWEVQHFVPVSVRHPPSSHPPTCILLHLLEVYQASLSILLQTALHACNT